MTKSEYIINLINLIINRVKFHAPKVQSDIDYALLNAIGIDETYPIFVFNRKMDILYYKAFLEAKKVVDFNLILTEKPEVSNKKLSKLNKTYVIYKEEIGSLLLSTLESLNINYVTHSDFKNEFMGEYLKINDNKLILDYVPYFYSKKLIYNGVIADVKSYILNGKNFCLSFTNTHNNKEEIDFEFNLPLPRGYYLFKRYNNNIEIENLTNKNKAYFNYNFNGGNITFSTMNGIESCTFASINLKCKLTLLSKEVKRVYFNFGERRYCLNTPYEMQYFFNLSQNKMNELFDLKVTTNNNDFDKQFNFYLPRKIWENWQKFDTDEESENLYLKMKNQIIKSTQNGVQISQDFKGLKEVKIYRNNQWKRVFILHNNSCYLFADRIKYFNFTLITKEIFDKNNEIYLSFAK